MSGIMRFRKVLRILTALVITSLVSLIYLFTWMRFYNPFMVYSPLYNNGVILLVLVYAILYIMFANLYNGFKVGHFRVSDVIYSQLTTLLIINTVTYIEVSLMDRRLLDPTELVVMTLVQFIVTVVWAYLANRVYYRVFKPAKVLFVHGTTETSNMLEKIGRRNDKFNVTTILSYDLGYEKIVERFTEHDVVFLYDIDSDIRNKLFKECYRLNIPVYITPKITDVIISASDWIHLFDTPLFLSNNTTISFEQQIIKRFVDILVSVFALVILSPLFILVAALIKFTDGGDVLFMQERVTLNNRVFKIYKFRSMIMNAEKSGEARLMSKNDERVTKVGKVIRKTRIDELPQLFNILIGDMSLVGPRPERPELIKSYCESIPEFDFRTRVKAGLTGYAQIMGKYNTSIYDKLKLDLMYIENYSLLLDLKILFATLKYVITPANEDSTEGV